MKGIFSFSLLSWLLSLLSLLSWLLILLEQGQGGETYGSNGQKAFTVLRHAELDLLEFCTG